MYSGGGSSMKWMAESTAVQRMRLVAEGKRRGHSNVRLRCLKVKIDSLEAINLHSLRVESSSPCSSPHLLATLQRFRTSAQPLSQDCTMPTLIPAMANDTHRVFWCIIKNDYNPFESMPALANWKTWSGRRVRMAYSMRLMLKIWCFVKWVANC